MNYNFGTAATPVSTQNYLKAWTIYDNVEFDGISGPVEGTSSNDKKWKRWDLTFKCPKGIYKEPIFEPMDDSATTRHTFDSSNGGKITFPSAIETINLIIQQVVSVYMNDTNKATFQKAAESGKFNNIEFSKFMELLKKLMKNPKKPSEDYPISLKLQGKNQNGKVYARLPNAAIATKGDHVGEAWMPRFLGQNLTLTAYELQQAKATVQSTPTDMENIDTPTNNDTTADDLDSLAKELENL